MTACVEPSADATSVTPDVPGVAELDRQVENLVSLGFPLLAGMTEAAFRGLLRPLRDAAAAISRPSDRPTDRLPFVIVLSPSVVRPEAALPRIRLRGKSAFTTMTADDLAAFRPVTELLDGHAVNRPDSPAYLAVDVDTGREHLDVPPQEAWGPIVHSGRSPLTLEEGVAVLAQQPEILRSHNCFSMLGSRCGDRRVTALWVSKGVPRLGWCWTGAPHTWLGSASCARRVGSS